MFWDGYRPPGLHVFFPLQGFAELLGAAHLVIMSNVRNVFHYGKRGHNFTQAETARVADVSLFVYSDIQISPYCSVSGSYNAISLDSGHRRFSPPPRRMETALSNSGIKWSGI